MTTLAEMIKIALENDSVVTAYVYGSFGFGKTSYALWTAYKVLGGWDEVLNYVYFHPEDAIRDMEKAVKTGVRLPIIIMDDAGLWLDKLSWWEENKIAFMQFFNVIRNITAGVIFTTPSDDLPKMLRQKCMFRVSVRPATSDEVIGLVGEGKYRELVSLAKAYGINQVFNIAMGYKLTTLPSFMSRVSKEFYDVYPLQYPIFEEYNKKRAKAVATSFVKWAVETRREARGREKLMEYAEELMRKGVGKSEVVKELMRVGVPKTTAYRWMRRLEELKREVGGGGGGFK